MKRIILEKSNLSPNFIGSWDLEDNSLCDELIMYFEKNPTKHKKGVTQGGLNTETKKTTDISILPSELNLSNNLIIKKYISSLFDCHKDYLIQWPFLSSLAQKLDIGSFNLQRYQAGDHFQQIHTERSSLDTLHRVLAWMTYLNDVDHGGSTYFQHYDIEVQPRKGLTLIWPAEWTHAHRGNLLHQGSKYIITGWMDFSV